MTKKKKDTQKQVLQTQTAELIKRPPLLEKAAELRRLAEEKEAQVPQDLAVLSPVKLQQLLHELRVHQIELEMQNEELRTAQAELDTARARYFDLYDQAPVGYVTLSDKGLILETNLTATTLLDTFRSAMIKQPLTKFIFKEDQDIYYLHHKMLLATDTPQVFELRMVKKAGPPCWVRVDATVAQDADGAPLYRVTLSDITARKQAEEALQTATAYTRSLIEASLDPLVTINANGNITDVNDALVQATGVPHAALIGTDFSNYFTEPAKAQEGYQRVFSVGFVRDYPLAIRNVSGQVTDVLYNATVYRDPQGRVAGVFAAARDISERKQAELVNEQLEAQNRQLQKAESLGRMAGAIAHHFNNQLQAVIGNLELATQDLYRGTEAFRTIVDAMHAAQQAAEVSRLMLTYLGQTPGTHAVLDLSKICRQNTSILCVGMPKNMVLEMSLPATGPAISASANQIQQVLANLLNNACESFESANGVIHLAVTTVVAADIPTANRFPIGCQLQDQEYACLTVTDTGSGIANQDIEKLFDPFFSTKFTGRGLGLPVVLGIVRAHKGIITVASKPGHGSVFRVFLPLATQAAPANIASPATPMEKAAAAGQTQAGTLLVVEDEAPVRNVFAGMLTRLGFTVLAAPDGVAALEVFQQHQADICCVLCDLTMPRMDGWATLTALRQIAPGLPVILASGYDEAQVMAGDHPELPNAFLGKPFQMQALRDALGKALAQ